MPKKRKHCSFGALVAFLAAAGLAQGVLAEEPIDPISATWSDVHTDTTPGVGIKFHGEYSNQAVTATLDHLPAHDFLSISFEFLALRSWDGSGRTNGGLGRIGPDFFRFGLGDGRTLIHATFSNTPMMPGFARAAAFQTYPSPVPGDSCSYMTGADFKNMLGYEYPWPGAPFPIRMDSKYTMHMTVPHTGETAVLNFRGMGLQGVEDESWGISSLNVRTMTAAEVKAANTDFKLVPMTDDAGHRGLVQSAVPWPPMEKLLQTAGGRGVGGLV